MSQHYTADVLEYIRDYLKNHTTEYNSIEIAPPILTDFHPCIRIVAGGFRITNRTTGRVIREFDVEIYICVHDYDPGECVKKVTEKVDDIYAELEPGYQDQAKRKLGPMKWYGINEPDKIRAQVIDSEPVSGDYLNRLEIGSGSFIGRGVVLYRVIIEENIYVH